MAHTDKDKPLKVRIVESNLDPSNRTFATKYHESTVGLNNRGIKALKRLAHKRNRRRAVPHTSMRGYGWGDENIRYGYSD